MVANVLTVEKTEDQGVDGGWCRMLALGIGSNNNWEQFWSTAPFPILRKMPNSINLSIGLNLSCIGYKLIWTVHLLQIRVPDTFFPPSLTLHNRERKLGEKLGSACLYAQLEAPSLQSSTMLGLLYMIGSSCGPHDDNLKHSKWISPSPLKHPQMSVHWKQVPLSYLSAWQICDCQNLI